MTIVALFALTAASCGASQGGPPGQCAGEQRPPLDCTSEIAYQGLDASGSFGVARLASGDARYEDKALREVDQETARYVAMQTRLCRDYNACVLDRETYARETKAIRDRLARTSELASALGSKKGESERKLAIDELYRAAVPDENRSGEVTLRFSMDAELPPSVGGGKVEVKPGATLPTNARAAFVIDVSPEAHVYIFQKPPSGELAVLFPDERIGTKNPLRGGELARIPGGDARFRLNEKDVGTELIYLAVSRKPLASLEAALARVSSGAVRSIGDDALLSSFATLSSAAAASVSSSAGKVGCRAFELERPAGPCALGRGLELEPGQAAGREPTRGIALAVRTEPGDDLIVQAFSFEHVTEAAFTARAHPAAPAPPPAAAPPPPAAQPGAARPKAEAPMERGPAKMKKKARDMSLDDEADEGPGDEIIMQE